MNYKPIACVSFSKPKSKLEYYFLQLFLRFFHPHNRSFSPTLYLAHWLVHLHARAIVLERDAGEEMMVAVIHPFLLENRAKLMHLFFFLLSLLNYYRLSLLPKGLNYSFVSCDFHHQHVLIHLTLCQLSTKKKSTHCFINFYLFFVQFLCTVLTTSFFNIFILHFFLS